MLSVFLEKYWRQVVVSICKLQSYLLWNGLLDMIGADLSFVSLWLLAGVLDPFLAVVDLVGEGRVDLNVGFTFSLALSGSPWRMRKQPRLSLLGGGKSP